MELTSGLIDNFVISRYFVISDLVIAGVYCTYDVVNNIIFEISITGRNNIGRACCTHEISWMRSDGVSTPVRRRWKISCLSSR